jgi:hypothetical protein
VSASQRYYYKVCSLKYTQVAFTTSKIYKCAGNGMELTREKDCTIFRDISIAYHSLRGKRSKKYVVDGVIFCTGTAQDHFVARWRGRDIFRKFIVQYNSLISQSVTPVEGWREKLNERDRVRVVFYRQSRHQHRSESKFEAAQ